MLLWRVKMLSSDEMILQIRKGNEEAMELLFNYCDIYGNKLLRKIKQNYSFLGIEYEDIKSYLRIKTLEAVDIYDMSKSSFLAFWLIVVGRKMTNMLNEKYRNDFNLQKINVDCEMLENYNFNANENSVKNYELRDSYNKSIDLVEQKYGSLDREILELWAKGYKYIEIAEKFNLTQQKVTITIFKAIKYLKNYKDEL